MDKTTNFPERANALGHEYTPEEITESLRVCFKYKCGCYGCIYHEHPDYSDIEVVCQEDLAVGAANLIEAQAKRIGELEELVEDRTKDVLFYAEREKWIPTSERLPGLRKPVLVSLRGCVQEGFLLSNGEWCCRHTVENMEAVTHWKPMPKGPEVEAR